MRGAQRLLKISQLCSRNLIFRNVIIVNRGVFEIIVIRTYSNLRPICFTSCVVYILEARARRERPLANAGHAIRDGDAGQAGAFIERIIANAGHAIGNSDACKTGAISVFASLFLSAIYILNGRKVVTWIL